MCVLLIVVCPFVLFLLAIVLSVLRYTDSDCPFGIFKLFYLSIAVIRKSFNTGNDNVERLILNKRSPVVSYPVIFFSVTKVTVNTGLIV
jgi:hypothetical protein